MISQIQGLQSFVANHLADVVDWGKHVHPDLERYPKQADGKPQLSGDQAFILISTPFNRYRMSICSSYIEPPPGAPIACKSLGTVTLHDMADNKHIVGPKADQTWLDISKHIHVRELTDALAAARREAAEASVEVAGPARVKLAELAERAKKWGIAAKVPEGLPSAQQAMLNPYQFQQGTAAQTSDFASQAQAIAQAGIDGLPTIHSIGEPVVASRDAPWLGAPVFFITNPGEQIGGMGEIVGWCVKVYSHDRISIFMTPDHSEPSYRDNLPRRGSPAGNGNVHRFNCWDFNPHFLLAMQRVTVNPPMIPVGDDALHTKVDDLLRQYDGLLGRVIALEAKRGPGRPAKVASVEPEKPEGSEAA